MQIQNSFAAILNKANSDWEFRDSGPMSETHVRSSGTIKNTVHRKRTALQLLQCECERNLTVRGLRLRCRSRWWAVRCPSRDSATSRLDAPTYQPAVDLSAGSGKQWRTSSLSLRNRESSRWKLFHREAADRAPDHFRWCRTSPTVRTLLLLLI